VKNIVPEELRLLWSRYCKNPDGNIAIIFAICVTILAVTISLAIDISTVTSKKSNMQDKIDAAILAATKLVFLDNKSEKEGQAVFDEMLQPFLSDGTLR